jgi:hypothetical protein
LQLFARRAEVREHRHGLGPEVHGARGRWGALPMGRTLEHRL